MGTMRKVSSYSPRTRKRIATLDVDQNLFVAIIAHELRDPLVPLKNLAHLLRSKNFDVTGLGQASRIIDCQVLAMARLIDDLLDVSRLRLGRLQVRREQVLISDIVGRAVETVQPLVAVRSHTLTVSLPLRPVVLDADATRLCQVLQNLIGNAAKYTNCGGQIHIDVQLEGSDVVIIVSDNGAGIASENLESIFEPYEQAGRAETAPSAGGLGIGLYIAKGLVEAHGGTLKAMSAGVGKGSELIIRLPCKLRALPMAEECVALNSKTEPRCGLHMTEMRV